MQPASGNVSSSRGWVWTPSGFAPTSGIPVTDRAFRYGISLFESFALRNGSAFLLDGHLHRLHEACETAGFDLPAGALDECQATLAKARDGFARIYVTGGDGAVTAPFDSCRVIILVEPREPIPSRVYHRGYDLAMHPGAHFSVLPGLKTGNYWPNLLAFREGVAASRNETLLFTHPGHLISACMANVFLVIDGRLLTPALATGTRPGVTREWAMAAPAVEALLTRAEVERASEIFLTSSWLGVMPAASLAGRPLADRNISATLRELYLKAAR